MTLFSIRNQSPIHNAPCRRGGCILGAMHRLLDYSLVYPVLHGSSLTFPRVACGCQLQKLESILCLSFVPDLTPTREQCTGDGKLWQM